MLSIYKTLFTTSLLCFTATAMAEVTITDAWVRATAPGQKVGAAYMTLTSDADSTLVAVASPNAGEVEIHSMTMNNGVMKMRMLKALPLTANKPEKLAPGGFHLMLFDLKAGLKAGEKVKFVLDFKDQADKVTQQTVELPIKEAQ